jgi:hypothetical protein
MIECDMDFVVHVIIDAGRPSWEFEETLEDLFCWLCYVFREFGLTGGLTCHADVVENRLWGHLLNADCQRPELSGLYPFLDDGQLEDWVEAVSKRIDELFITLLD